MSDLPAYVVPARHGVLLSVFVQPKAATDGLVGVHGAALKLKVRAAPEGGRANAAACRVVAETLGVPASAVEVVSGGASRHKRIAVAGLEAGVAAARVEAALAAGGRR